MNEQRTLRQSRNKERKLSEENCFKMTNDKHV